MINNRPFLKSALRNPKSAILIITLFSVACAVAVLGASWRHTGSLSFPIDDGYIYSNYVLSAAQGAPFTYNPGETSGGITGLAWAILSVLAYWLLAPFHALLGGLAPAEVQAASVSLSQQAGHLYVAAYLPGVLCLAFTSLGVYRLADLVLSFGRGEGRDERAREYVCLLLGLIAAADLGLVWGALSGLEVALSSAIAVWAVALLLSDLRSGALRWSLVLAALLPWARPDLLAIAGACVLWLLLRALFASPAERAAAWRNTLVYTGASGAGLALMCIIYFVGWGRPLPSSFYAKVGGLRLGTKMLSAVQELLIAGRYLPFVGAGFAVVGGVVGLLPSKREDELVSSSSRNESRWATLLLLMVVAFYVVALMLTLPWFGQEDRYLLPLHPFVIVLAGILIRRIVDMLSLDRVLARAAVRTVSLVIIAAILLGAAYLWATRNYAVEVRNIRDAHITPALWIAANTEPAAVIASEPIGAVRLFSERRTVDLVGLTTPATLSTYRDWPRAWPALRSAGATHLFFYPDWFDDAEPPPWAIEVQRFAIPDNRIAGSSVIAVYRLDWSLFTDSP